MVYRHFCFRLESLGWTYISIAQLILWDLMLLPFLVKWRKNSVVNRMLSDLLWFDSRAVAKCCVLPAYPASLVKAFANKCRCSAVQVLNHCHTISSRACVSNKKIMNYECLGKGDGIETVKEFSFLRRQGIYFSSAKILKLWLWGAVSLNGSGDISKEPKVWMWIVRILLMD